MTIKKQIPTIPISVAPFNEGAMVGTPKALKAMWTNLSKDQLHLIYFFGGYVLFVSVTALAAASILKWVV